MTFGQLLKLKRKELDLTQMDIAEKLNVSVLTVSKWEGDEVIPTEDEKRFLNNLLGMEENLSFEKPQEEKLSDVITNIEETPAKVQDVKAKARVEETPAKVQDVKAKARVEETHEEDEIDKTSPSLEKDDRPVLGTCHRCKKTIYDREDLVSTEYKVSFERRSICLCRNCKKLCKQELLMHAKEKRIADAKKRRIKALVIQAIITLIGFAFAAIFVLYNYIVTIVIAAIAFNVGLLVANFIFDNTAPIHSFIELTQSVREDMDEFREKYPYSRYTSPLSGLVMVYAPVIFIISIFIYPFALIKNIMVPKDNSEIFISPYEKDAYYARLDTKFYFDQRKNK